MRNLNHYTREMEDIARKTENTGSSVQALATWVMLGALALFTGTFTYLTTLAGMVGRTEPKDVATWMYLAAALPCLLLEGTALLYTAGRHSWLRGQQQRKGAERVGWAIFGLLFLTTAFHFTRVLYPNAQGLDAITRFYGAWLLPLFAVAAGASWKFVHEKAPDSEMRSAVLEVEAELKAELIAIKRAQNVRMVESYRNAMESPRVAQAEKALFEQASLEHAKEFVSFIRPDGEADKREENKPSFPLPKPIIHKSASADGKGNGISTWGAKDDPSGKI